MAAMPVVFRDLSPEETAAVESRYGKEHVSAYLAPTEKPIAEGVTLAEALRLLMSACGGGLVAVGREDTGDRMYAYALSSAGYPVQMLHIRNLASMSYYSGITVQRESCWDPSAVFDVYRTAIHRQPVVSVTDLRCAIRDGANHLSMQHARERIVRDVDTECMLAALRKLREALP